MPSYSVTDASVIISRFTKRRSPERTIRFLASERRRPLVSDSRGVRRRR